MSCFSRSAEAGAVCCGAGGQVRDPLDCRRPVKPSSDQIGRVHRIARWYKPHSAVCARKSECNLKTEGRPKFGSKVNQGRPAPLESTNDRAWLLSIEYRECCCLHII